MILPRPIPEIDRSAIAMWLLDRIKRGDELEFCHPSRMARVGKTWFHHHCDGLFWVAPVPLNKGAKLVKVGVLDFYCHCKLDFGLINDPISGKMSGKMSPATWLLMGIDGKSNLDRLCEAWAKNGELIPTTSPAGMTLRGILNEMNAMVKKGDEVTLAEASEAINLIDNNLVKFNTYIQDLAAKSGLKFDSPGLGGGNEPAM